MEIKLDIYKKKEIIKTYKTDTYDLMFGTVEDFANLINIDKLKTCTDAEIIKLAGKAMFSGMDIIKVLLKDVFTGLTDEELRHTKSKDIVKVLVEIVKFTLNEIGKSITSKN